MDFKLIETAALILELAGFLRISHAVISHLSIKQLLKELVFGVFSKKRALVNANLSTINEENIARVFQGIGLVVISLLLKIVLSFF